MVLEAIKKCMTEEEKKANEMIFDMSMTIDSLEQTVKYLESKQNKVLEFIKNKYITTAGDIKIIQDILNEVDNG